MELKNARGTKDFPPEEKILRNEIVDKLKSVFEIYGYSPFESPIIERFDVLATKGGAGLESDALKETFKLTDQGNRKLGLRFELTLSFARFIGMNPSLKLPFKRYDLGPVFRDGPIKFGRYRQFWQCDVDVVGSKKMITDAEIIILTLDCFKGLKLDAYLKLNNRKLLKGIIEFIGISSNLADSVIITIDKLEKYGKSTVTQELKSKGIEESKIKKLLNIFATKGSNLEKLKTLKKQIKNPLAQEGITELEEIFSYLTKEQQNKVIFNISLARGLGYYTGPIFEGYVKKSKIKSSICGGGRYDKLIPSLLNSKQDYPATGISFGLDVISDILKEQKKEIKKTVTQVYIIPIKTLKESLKVAQELRKANIKTEIDISEKNISKNLDYANKKSIPYVIFIGSEELKKKKVKLRDMKSGKESFLTVKDLIKKI